MCSVVLPLLKLLHSRIHSIDRSCDSDCESTWFTIVNGFLTEFFTINKSHLLISVNVSNGYKTYSSGNSKS